MRVFGRLTLAASMIVGGSGCPEKDNPLWMVGSGGGSDSGGASSSDSSSMATTTTTRTTSTGTSTSAGTSEGAESGSGACPLEFEAAFDGTEDFRSDVMWTYEGSAVGPACPFLQSFVSYDDLLFTEGVFEAEVTVDSLCPEGPGLSGYRGAGVLARLGENLNCADFDAMYCIMNVFLQQVELGTSDENCNGDQHSPDIREPPVPFEEGQQYSIRLEITGNEAVCVVGEGTPSRTEVRLGSFGVVPPMGTVGFWAESARVTIDSFRACGS